MTQVATGASSPIVPEARQLIGEIREFVGDAVEELGSQREIAYIDRILAEGNGADRQLRVFNETNDLKQVVDYMITETEYGLFEGASQ